MSLIYTGNPITGDANDNFIVDVETSGIASLIHGEGGDDYILGDSTNMFTAVADGSTAGTGTILTRSITTWSLDDNPDVANATSIPHAAIFNSGVAGETSWYQVEVVAGQTITLDIDYGAGDIGGSFDSEIRILDGSLNFVAEDDDSFLSDGAGGSTGVSDSFLQYTFTAAGTYFIQVGTFAAGTAVGNFLGGEEYFLNVSLTGQSYDPPSRPASDTIYGGAGNDVIYGMGGDDYLHGGEGEDLMRGGGGNDTLHIDLVADINEGETYDGGAGTDTLHLADTYLGSPTFNLSLVTLSSIEALRFADPGSGRSTTALLLASQLGTGLAKTAEIQFSGFSDVSDTLAITMGSVTSLSLGGLRFTGADQVNDRTSITGDADAEMMTGSSLSDNLRGNDGNDTLSGSAGNDITFGGIGDDTHFVNQAGDIVFEFTGEGTNDRVAASASYKLATGAEVERLTTTAASGTLAINLTGNELAQTITGNAGANALSSGATGAADTLAGLAGDDLYHLFNAGDIIVETAGGGTNDRVVSEVSYTLAADDNIEVLSTFSAAGTGAISLIGNALAQKIYGNAGVNTLSSGAAGAADSLTGYGGNDTYRVFNAGDLIVEGAGGGSNDRVITAVSFVLASNDDIEQLSTNSAPGLAAINLTGNALAQTITGNAGANRLDGKGGIDTLQGGLGADVFVFTSTVSAANADRVLNYDAAVDRIELENAVFTGMIDTGTSLAGSAFTANATGSATQNTHRIIYETDTGILWFDRDGAASGFSAIQFATVDIGTSLSASEFTVI